MPFVKVLKLPFAIVQFVLVFHWQIKHNQMNTNFFPIPKFLLKFAMLQQNVDITSY